MKSFREKLGTAARVAALIAPLAGCATTGNPPAQASLSQPNTLVVRVVNYGWSDVRVSALVGPNSHRLGTVTPNSTASFKMLEGFVSGRTSVRLAAAPIGSSERFVSETILFQPGDVLEWQLEDNLDHSRVFVFAGSDQ